MFPLKNFARKGLIFAHKKNCRHFIFVFIIENQVTIAIHPGRLVSYLNNCVMYFHQMRLFSNLPHLANDHVSLWETFQSSHGIPSQQVWFS